MATAKTAIIEELFNQRFSAVTARVANPLVTLQDVSKAIIAYNATNPPQQMSTRNPANFFKDFIRNRASANRNWPTAVFGTGFTAR